MKLHASVATRRALVAAAVTCAAAVAPATALASSAQHADGTRAIPSCTTSGLDVWLDTQGSGAAGHTYYFLNFTNLSGSTCVLSGYPGVSGVTLTGAQVGSAAGRNGVTPNPVTLANGATTHALVGVVNPGIIPPSQCHPVTAAGLRVYPPNQTQSKLVPYPFPACSAKGPVYLTVGPVGFP
ncbi:MAG TPA: DUF4232 domain-containing protein [Streptosporangiaceae bacterium]|nr:DUF4232 domain-containing protein [Streptosporangiaceae bacterium]